LSALVLRLHVLSRSCARARVSYALVVIGLCGVALPNDRTGGSAAAPRGRCVGGDGAGIGGSRILARGQRGHGAAACWRFFFSVLLPVHGDVVAGVASSDRPSHGACRAAFQAVLRFGGDCRG